MNERMINIWFNKNAQEYTEDMEDGLLWYDDCTIVASIYAVEVRHDTSPSPLS